MVKVVFQILIFLLFQTFCELHSQPDDITLHQQQLSNLKNEIQQLEQQLEQKSVTEKKSFEVFENINKQSFLVNKIVVNLHYQESLKQNEIDYYIKKIADLEKESKTLKINYAKYIVANYKGGSYSEWQSVIESNSFQQAVIRLEYLKRFSESRKNDLLKLNNNKKELLSSKEKLEIDKKEKQNLSYQKEFEKESLKKKLADEKKILADIKKDKNLLSKRVNEKRKAEKKIKDLILLLVGNSEKKSKEELLKTESAVNVKQIKENKVEPIEYSADLSTTNFVSFSDLKGKLNYPIPKGKIVRKFGENINSILNTVTINYGVDIKAGADLNVKCVAEGVVSALEWLPGYGTILIISHKNNYRTVYGHLSEVFVNEGKKIKTGESIGKIGESLEGTILHFEIWNARENVNP
jgi:septal ring factor EnvC (AmiA/AmiB activator)